MRTYICEHCVLRDIRFHDPNFVLRTVQLEQDALLQELPSYYGTDEPFADDRLRPEHWCHSSQLTKFVQYLVVRDAAFCFFGLPVTAPFLVSLASVAITGFSVLYRFAN